MAKKSSKNHARQKPQKAYAAFTPDKGTYVQRTHKDTLFRFIFRNKQKLLQLYNALSSSDYKDTDLLTITSLENVLYLGYKNDISFLIDMTLYLVEHQGSWNPNMPLRGVFYFARLYQNYIDENGYDLYGSKAFLLPYPQFIVFYNGTAKKPERQILKLSDSFPQKQAHGFFTPPALECQALMLNINYGNNRQLMENCRPLMEYSQFIHQIRQYITAGYTPAHAVDSAVNVCIQKGILADVLKAHRKLMEYSQFIHQIRQYITAGYTPAHAVDSAVNVCIQKGILADVLKAHRKEVITMFLEDYDEELHLRTLRREGYEDGMEQLNRLVKHLLADNRMDDLKRSLDDSDFQKALLKEYDL